METEVTDTITISKAEYEALLAAQDDLADIKAVADYRTSGDDGLPLEYMKRLLEGEAPLKVWRTFRGLSQNALAQMSGVNRVQIGDIEERGKAGSVATLRKLAETLRTTIDDLVA